MKTIPLSRGKIALVDDDDFERVSQNTWTLKKSSKDKTEYAHRHIKLDGKWRHISLHRFIMCAPIGLEVDHIDGDGLNCQKHNMRLCTHAENMRNRRMKNKHGLKGVAFVKNLLPHRQWVAQISTNTGKKIMRYFPSKAEAAAAYNAMAMQYFGEFARINPNV